MNKNSIKKAIGRFLWKIVTFIVIIILLVLLVGFISYMIHIPDSIDNKLCRAMGYEKATDWKDKFNNPYKYELECDSKDILSIEHGPNYTCYKPDNKWGDSGCTILNYDVTEEDYYINNTLIMVERL